MVVALRQQSNNTTGRLSTSCARFLSLFLSFGSFPFRELVFPSRTQANSSQGRPQAVGRKR